MEGVGDLSPFFSFPIFPLPFPWIWIPSPSPLYTFFFPLFFPPCAAAFGAFCYYRFALPSYLPTIAANFLTLPVLFLVALYSVVALPQAYCVLFYKQHTQQYFLPCMHFPPCALAFLFSSAFLCIMARMHISPTAAWRATWTFPTYLPVTYLMTYMTWRNIPSIVHIQFYNSYYGILLFFIP